MHVTFCTLHSPRYDAGTGLVAIPASESGIFELMFVSSVEMHYTFDAETPSGLSFSFLVDGLPTGEQASRVLHQVISRNVLVLLGIL